MITTGRFDRSSCYWAKYVTLTGEERMLHASSSDIKAWSARYGITQGITSRVISFYFHTLIKNSVDSATYARNTVKLPKVRLARTKVSA